jgi:hypothetical protein
MIQSKYVRSSGIHRTLEMISIAPKTDTEMRQKITAECAARYYESCIAPLLVDGYATALGDGTYQITDEGREKLEQLGAPKAKLPHRRPATLYERGNYIGGEIRMRPVRPGADDHEQVPSLVGNKRIWRDGRVQAYE